jgi:bifunctional polynucleotide phosphatase/kinase
MSSQYNEISNCFRYRRKMMGLDYDHTIVKPKNGRTFPKNVHDWEWLRPNVPEIINSYYKKGFAIVVFTNQFKPFKMEQIKIVMDTIGCPYKVYAAYDKDIKKPSTFLFDIYKKPNFNFKHSFYVGDAMGRQQDWSDSDKQFALKCGLVPKTPEEIFPFKNEVIYIQSTHVDGEKNKNPYFEKIPIAPKEKQEIIILVGYPGSGKTTVTYLFEHQEHYDILHGDELKTESKMKRALKIGLENKKSVIIDATNPSIKKRNVFIEIAKKYNPEIYIRIIELSTTIEESMYRNSFREKPIPKIAFYMFRKNYEAPTEIEGINEIIVL